MNADKDQTRMNAKNANDWLRAQHKFQSVEGNAQRPAARQVSGHEFYSCHKGPN